jgi:ankyrin repeat protein
MIRDCGKGRINQAKKQPSKKATKQKSNQAKKQPRKTKKPRHFKMWATLISAVEQGRTQHVVQIIVEKPRLLKRAKLLLHACRQGNTETLLALLGLGANVNVKDRLHRTPLIAVAHNQRFGAEIVDILIKAGACINGPFCYAYPPLIEALRLRNDGVTRALVKNGVNLDLVDDQGWNALMHAVYHCTPVEILGTLIGSNINYVGNGTTALILSTKGGNYRACEFLISVGADPYVQDKNGDTALIMALVLARPRV